VVDLALRLKRDRAAGVDQRYLPGKVLGLVFEKPSLRTRVSFEAAIAHFGGACIFLTGKEVGLGERETIADFAGVMSGYVDALAIRTFAHSRVEELAAHSEKPVINALSDREHPCQALGDLATVLEHFGRLDGIKIAFVGDANNVSKSLATAARHCGVDFTLASPPQHSFDEEFLERVAKSGGTGKIRTTTDPIAAVKGADVVYTDVWASMGQEAEAQARREAFAPYRVDAALFRKAAPGARFLHCLPARRGEEVTTEVIDGPASLIFRQAEFRLHAQKALLLWLITGTLGVPATASAGPKPTPPGAARTRAPAPAKNGGQKGASAKAARARRA
jgi:ornithine carbamoyltransferase